MARITTKEKRMELVNDAIMRQEELKRKAYFAWRDKRLDKSLFDAIVRDINQYKKAEVYKIKNKLTRQQIDYRYKKLVSRRLDLRIDNEDRNYLDD